MPEQNFCLKILMHLYIYMYARECTHSLADDVHARWRPRVQSHDYQHIEHADFEADDFVTANRQALA